MSEQFVPETDEVRERFVEGKSEYMYAASWIDGYDAEFDRWLSAHDRQVKAEAWDEAVEAMAWAQQNGPEQHWLPYVRDNSPYRIESQETP